MNCVMVKMGGKGVRFGEEVPKQFYEINGKPLFAYVLEQYLNLNYIDKYIIVTNNNWLEYTLIYANQILGDKLLEVIPGGETNAMSIYNGVICASKYLSANDILLIHDVTDPIVDSVNVKVAIEEAEKYNVAALYTEQVHSIYKKNNEDFVEKTIPKNEVGPGYSPEAFMFDKIYKCYKNATEQELKDMTSAVALVTAHGEKIKLVQSHVLSLKITYREDIEIFRAILQSLDLN